MTSAAFVFLVRASFQLFMAVHALVMKSVIPIQNKILFILPVALAAGREVP
jgi:hypothetical protein